MVMQNGAEARVVVPHRPVRSTSVTGRMTPGRMAVVRAPAAAVRPRSVLRPAPEPPTRPGGAAGRGRTSGAVRPVRGVCVRPAPAAEHARLRLTRRGRRVVVALVLAGALALCALLGSVLSSGSDGLRLVGESSVVVESGDTLWSIASSVAGDDRDVRVVVDEIRRVNGLRDGTLLPGQVLQLP